jgi:hypothetical protein
VRKTSRAKLFDKLCADHAGATGNENCVRAFHRNSFSLKCGSHFVFDERV